jgi:hypothetical protein
MIYIGISDKGEQVFVNINNVLAVLDNGSGEAPTKVLMAGGTEVTIVDKSWAEITDELNRNL